MCFAAPSDQMTMIKAVLFSPDGTLLRCDERALADEYLRLATAYFDELWGASRSACLLAEAQRALAAPRDAQTTNSSLLAETLAAAAGRDPQDIHAAFDAFYTAHLPALRDSVRPAAAAVEVIALAQQQGLDIVIAANPLHPAAAVRQRLAWAGLPDSTEDYALVTGSDNTHFVKPDPAYYAEIVARIGVEPDEAIMVGSSLVDDVRPAAAARLRTYHIGAGVQDDSAADGVGSLAELALRIKSAAWLDTLPPRALKPEAVEPQLWGNVGALFGMLANVQPAYWEQRPDPNEWSILQIVCHLLESERHVQRPRLERILAEDNPFLVNPPPPGLHAPPCDSDGHQAARRFAAARSETLALLRALPAAAWGRPARHSVFGLTTLLEMALFTAQHDRLHLNQLCQTLGRCE